MHIYSTKSKHDSMHPHLRRTTQAPSIPIPTTNNSSNRQCLILTLRTRITDIWAAHLSLDMPLTPPCPHRRPNTAPRTVTLDTPLQRRILIILASPCPRT